jgi:hypothetical protein
MASLLLMSESQACSPGRIENAEPNWFFEDEEVSGLFLGTVEEVTPLPSTYGEMVTVRVLESLKGTNQSVETLWNWVLPGCHFGSNVGDKVAVLISSKSGAGVFLFDPESPYASKLREGKRRAQSNSTVEGDARKSGARPSP